jgi:hypothetical protein
MNSMGSDGIYVINTHPRESFEVERLPNTMDRVFSWDVTEAITHEGAIRSLCIASKEDMNISPHQIFMG